MAANVPPRRLWTPELLRFARGAFTALNSAAWRGWDPWVTSWHRSAWENQAVGGADRSLHLEGLAMDVDLIGHDTLGNLRTFGRMAEQEGLAAIVYYDATRSYVHLQARPLLSGATFTVA